MRIRILTIVFLLCAVFVAATVGTLSSYNLSSDSSVGLSPDSDKINEQYAAAQEELLLLKTPEVDLDLNLDPEQSLEPDTAALPEGVDVLPELAVNGNGNVTNEEGFVVITGDVTQKDENASLEFGAGDSNTETEDPYVLYFEPGTQVNFADGTSADMSGFYEISSGEDLFDKSLYQETKDGYRLKEDNGELKVCTDVVDTCDELEIPLKVKD